MNRKTGLILLALGVLLAPATGSAQKAPGNNMYTRSASLYMDRAQGAQRPEEKQALYKQALDAALQSVQAEPQNARGYLLAAQAHIRMLDIVAADSMFRKAEALHPGFAKEIDFARNNAWIAAYNMGVNAIQAGQIEAAIKAMEAADVIYQKRPLARLNLGSLYVQTNQMEKAAEAYRGALVILRQPAEGIAQIDADKYKEWEQTAAFNLAQILAGTGKDEEAVAAYREYLQRDPGNITAQLNLAVVLTRQKKVADAAKIYSDLLAKTDLSDRDYFMIGVGMFQAENYLQAAEAFRKATALNTNFRDAYYNLAQAIYVEAGKIEDLQAKAKPADAKKFDPQLRPMYEQLRDAAEKARTFDPNNRNLLALLARAYRGLGDTSPDLKAGEQQKLKALEMLKTHEAMPFEVTEVQLEGGEGKVTLKGHILNLKLKPGQPVKMRFTFFGPGGAPLGSQEVTVSAAAADQTAAFTVSQEAKENVTGWKYEIVS